MINFRPIPQTDRGKAKGEIPSPPQDDDQEHLTEVADHLVCFCNGMTRIGPQLSGENSRLPTLVSPITVVTKTDSQSVNRSQCDCLLKKKQYSAHLKSLYASIRMHVFSQDRILCGTRRVCHEKRNTTRSLSEWGLSILVKKRTRSFPFQRDDFPSNLLNMIVFKHTNLGFGLDISNIKAEQVVEPFLNRISSRVSGDVTACTNLHFTPHERILISH